MKKIHEVRITPEKVEVNGKRIFSSATGRELLKEMYHVKIGDYPKFHKMDILCQLGFVASELLLAAEGKVRFIECDDRAIMLFGKNSSLCADLDYQQTISNRQEFFPSPLLFVYTLPNIVTGEIALRNKYHGETSYLVVDDLTLIDEYIETFMDTSLLIKSAICGWIDTRGKNDFEANLWIIEK